MTIATQKKSQSSFENAMRDIIDIYLIAGVSFGRLRKILCGLDASVSVRSIANGTILLSNNRVLSCVSEIWKLKGEKKIKKKANAYISCAYVQSALSLREVKEMDCKNCHLECIKRWKDGQLERV